MDASVLLLQDCHVNIEYTYFFIRNQWKGTVLKVSWFYYDFSTEIFLFGFLDFYIAERITLKTILTSFIKHLLLTLFLAHRSLLIGRIKEKQTIIQLKKSKKIYHVGSVYKNLMERYFALKISFLIFRRPKNSVLRVS